MTWLWLPLFSAFAGEPDRLALAARLIADDHADRAIEVLAEVEPGKKELGRYHTLLGIAAFESGDPARAAEQLQLAVQHEVQPIAWVTLAAAREATGDLRGAADALDRPDVDELVAAWVLRGRVGFALGEHDAAYETVLLGQERFPDAARLRQEALRQLLALGLYQQVAESAPGLLIDAEEEQWVVVLDGLLQAPEQALTFGESMLLAHPDSVRARVGLASACLALERNACAGQWLAQASAWEPRYAVQAAECFRRDGDLERALYLNTTVVDPTEKARQRLGLLLEARRFTAAAALDARLTRLELLEEEAVAYALAYAHAQTGGEQRAEQLITRLTDPGLVRQGTALLESL